MENDPTAKNIFRWPAINWLFGLTIFLAAFLSFQIEPLISKYILPWFGGSTAVWTTAIMFFQVLLLAGYAYAHYLNKLSLSKQRIVHLIVSAMILSWMVVMVLRWDTPVTPDESWKPLIETWPIGQVLLVLLVSVGLPYFLLTTTSSLIQSWFSKVRQQASPYAFYALSNTASLLALISYPVMFEPTFTVRQQATIWSIGFGVYLLVLAACTIQTRSVREGISLSVSGDEPISNVVKGQTEKPPSKKTYLFWISLAACASVMLLASTNHMCQDVASVPFLWVLPLSIYLLSFVVAFHDYQKRPRSLYAILTLAALALGLWNLAYGTRMNIWIQIGSNSFMLFSISLLCHSELYLRRPSPRFLTGFYLMLSIGGALGGVLVNLLAPLIFPDYWEYNLGLIYCAIIVIMMAYQSRGTWLYRLRIPIAVIALVLSVFILALPIAWVQKSIEIRRNFYGVVKIRPMDGTIPGYEMIHGTITHGGQASIEPYHDQPTMYFTQSSGIGQVILNHPRRQAEEPIKIGIIGLGVGTLASYGQTGDVIKYYEIDPNVIEFAEDERYFSFLKDSPSTIDIVLGDARLSLEQESAKGELQGYDILVVDAFSGDSIPAHLISKEAIKLYLTHIQPDGILAFHITNRHINLEPVLALAGEYFKLPGVIVQQNKPEEIMGTASTWVIFSQNQDIFNTPGLASLKRELQKKPGIRMWTDDYGNLFRVLW